MTEQVDPLAYLSDWRWNSQAPPPINGQIRTNSQDWSNAATHLFISNQTDGGVDVSTQLRAITLGATLDIAMKTDATRSVRFTTTALPIAQTTYVDIPVTFVTFSGAIPNSGTLVSLTVTPPVPPSTITWQVLVLAGRPNRFTLRCSCVHGAIEELCGTYVGGVPVPPQTTIESTAMNLLRRTGCTCRGIVAGASRAVGDVQFDELVDGVGL